MKLNLKTSRLEQRWNHFTFYNDELSYVQVKFIDTDLLCVCCFSSQLAPNGDKFAHKKQVCRKNCTSVIQSDVRINFQQSGENLSPSWMITTQSINLKVKKNYELRLQWN